jgi:hypothetical protein
LKVAAVSDIHANLLLLKPFIQDANREAQPFFLMLVTQLVSEATLLK